MHGKGNAGSAALASDVVVQRMRLTNERRLLADRATMAAPLSELEGSKAHSNEHADSSEVSVARAAQGFSPHETNDEQHHRTNEAADS